MVILTHPSALSDRLGLCPAGLPKPPQHHCYCGIESDSLGATAAAITKQTRNEAQRLHVLVVRSSETDPDSKQRGILLSLAISNIKPTLLISNPEPTFYQP